MQAETVTSESASNSTLRRLSRWWAIAGLALIGVTWKLWIPQSEFPRVPLFGWATQIPVAVEWICLTIVILALLIAVVVPQRASPSIQSVAWQSFAAAMTVMCLFNQQRLQPWAYQLVLMSFFFVTYDQSLSKVRWLRFLTISIYFWSAVSKCDSTFFNTHGQTFVTVLFNQIGFEGPKANVGWWIASLFPVGELLIAIGLAIPRFRRFSLWGAIGLHGLLSLILGPLGLQHRPGVLLWNVAFMVHDWLLFRSDAATPDVATLARAWVCSVKTPRSGERGYISAAAGQLRSGAAQIAAIVAIASSLLPILEPFGLLDRWPAWAVYTARGERVSVVLTESGQRQLTESARRILVDGELPLDRWSLEALDAPIYPQLRFQLGVVEWLRLRCSDEAIIEVTLQSSGSSAKMPYYTERLTLSEWQRIGDSFWLNTIPHRD